MHTLVNEILNSYEVTYFLMLLFPWIPLIIIYFKIACMKIAPNYLSLVFLKHSIKIFYLGQSFDICMTIPPIVGTAFLLNVPSK